MSKRYALFANANSGENTLDYKRHGKYVRLNVLKKMIEDHNGKVYITGNSHDYVNEVDQQVELACKYEPDVVFIQSGDGGTLTFLTRLIAHWPYTEKPFPLIAHPKGGTFGILANRLDIRDPVVYVKNILKTKELGNLTVKDIKLMRVEDDSGYSHVSFSVGTGFPVRLLKEAYKKKHLKNLRIGMMTLRSIFSAIANGNYYRRFDGQQKMTISTKSHFDEVETCTREWLALIAQTISSIGLPKGLPRRQEIFQKAETAEDTFHAIGVDYNFRRMLWEMPQIYIGEAGTYRDRKTDEERRVLLLDKQLQSLTITADEPFEYQSCGEIFAPTKTLYINSYKTVRFIAGNHKVVKNVK